MSSKEQISRIAELLRLSAAVVEGGINTWENCAETIISAVQDFNNPILYPRKK